MPDARCIRSLVCASWHRDHTFLPPVSRPALLTFAQRPPEWNGMAVDIALICISVNQNILKIRTFLRLGDGQGA